MVDKKQNKTDSLEKVTNVAVTFADWTLEQIKSKEPKELERKARGYWASDCLRLEENLRNVNQEPSYENATKLTNLACGLIKIYEGVPYKK